jgi:hypothetical protein
VEVNNCACAASANTSAAQVNKVPRSDYLVFKLSNPNAIEHQQLKEAAKDGRHAAFSCRKTPPAGNGWVKNVSSRPDAVSKTGFPVKTDTQNQGWLRFPNRELCEDWTRLRQRFAPRGGEQAIPFFATQRNLRRASSFADALGIGRTDDGHDA